ncbi:MAG: NAD-dependent epimerase/dehydratase family protein [Humidesulfovibrio sp.]
MKRKAVVIGGSGFLGSHVADALSDQGFDTLVFDNRPSPWLRSDQQMAVGDVLNPDDLKSALDGAFCAYHLAGIADLKEAAAKPQDVVRVNIIGSSNAIEAALAAGVQRFVFASTVYVYSQQGSFYRVSKQAVEALLETYQKEFGLEYTILRYGSLYGPRSQEWNGLKRYVAQAVKTGILRYPGTGEERREYIHVKDAAKMSVEALDPQYANACLTLTGAQVHTSRELVTLIKEILGGKLDVQFAPELFTADHYSITPYRYTPKEARKMVPTTFFDLGQGVLELIEEVHREAERGT